MTHSSRASAITRSVTMILLLLMVPPHLFAGEKCQKATPIPAATQPRFAVPDTYPWGYSGDHNQPLGLLSNYFDYLSGKTGIPYKGVLLPYSRIVHSLQSGEIDFGVLMDDQTYNNVVKVGKVVNLDILLVTRVDSRPVSSIDDLTGKDVGFLRGWKMATAFFAKHHVHGVQVNTINQGLSMLLSGRIEAMTGTPYSIPLAARALGSDASKLRLDFTIGLGSMSLYMAKESHHAATLKAYRGAISCFEEEDQAPKVFGAL